jgi:DNA-directed RNA polymerase specialized sigma24 family protein
LFTFLNFQHLEENSFMSFFSRKKTDTEKQLDQLYKKWPEVKRFLQSIGCDVVTAEDLFQEALLIYIRKVEEPDFQLTVEPVYYVKNTCKLLWYNLSRKQNKHPHISEVIEIQEVESEWMQKEMKLKSIENVLTKIGEQCQIAEIVGLRNDKVVKAQKYRCIQKAKELMQNEEESINLSIF